MASQKGGTSFGLIIGLILSIFVIIGLTYTTFTNNSAYWQKVEEAKEAALREADATKRETEARVSFGTRWVKDSVLEIYQEDIARFRTLVGTDLEEDVMAKLDRGEVPMLKALRLHNGTIYRWNRPVYDVVRGKPHLRVENRVLPAGPPAPLVSEHEP